MVVLDGHVGDARQALELGPRHGPGEAQLDLVVGEVAQGLDAVDLAPAGRRG